MPTLDRRRRMGNRPRSGPQGLLLSLIDWLKASVGSLSSGFNAAICHLITSWIHIATAGPVWHRRPASSSLCLCLSPSFWVIGRGRWAACMTKDPGLIPAVSAVNTFKAAMDWHEKVKGKCCSADSRPDQTRKIQYAGNFKETVLFSCYSNNRICFIIKAHWFRLYSVIYSNHST